ncbi:MAG: REJ domain-containing protein [Desulfobacterales bacterium]
MKRYFNLLVASLLLIFFVGCGSSGGSSSETNDTQTTSIPEPITSNLAPVANVVADQTVTVGNSMNLYSTGSYDPDENYPLTYEWQIISKPSGSEVESFVPDFTAPSFTFTADSSGEYKIQLVVGDSLGTKSEPYEVVVSASDDSNLMPVADAGPDQTLAYVGINVDLDGSRSYDPDGNPITYAWSIIQKPEESSAVLTDPTAVNPTFVADLLGSYVIELKVTDSLGLESLTDEVVITSENVKPVADAGVNQVVVLGDIVNLDGSDSYDVNPDDQLTYSWNIVSKPIESPTELIDSDTVNPYFEANFQGTYILNLVVNDGTVDSDPSDVTISVLDEDNPDDVIINALMDAILAINELDADDFNNEKNRDTLTSKIIEVINIGTYDQAMLDKLRDDIGSKMDGCANGTEPDQNDWIMNCTAQDAVYPLIKLAILELEKILTPQ